MAEARSPKRWEFSENLWFSSFQNIIITSKSVPVKLVKFSLGSRNICVVLVGKKIQLKTCTTELLLSSITDILDCLVLGVGLFIQREIFRVTWGRSKSSSISLVSLVFCSSISLTSSWPSCSSGSSLCCSSWFRQCTKVRVNVRIMKKQIKAHPDVEVNDLCWKNIVAGNRVQPWVIIIIFIIIFAPFRSSLYK